MSISTRKNLDCYATLENYSNKKVSDQHQLGEREEPPPKKHVQAQQMEQEQNRVVVKSPEVVPEHHIEPLEGDRLYELLTDSRYFYIKNGTKPAKLLIKCETSTCKPCHAINPFFERLACDPRFMNEILFIRVDVDKMGAKARSLFPELNVVPTFFYFCEGKKLDMTVAGDRSEIEQKCLKLLNFPN